MQGKKKRILSVLLAWTVLFTSCITGGSSAAAAPKKVTKITLNYKSASTYIGGTLKLKVASVTPKKASKSVKWKTSNKKVAVVSASGVVRGKKTGTVTITAESKFNKKATAKCKVKVYKATKKLTLNGKSSYTMNIGKTVTLKTKVTPAKGAQPISWSSKNVKIAKVNKKGKVTAVSSGKTGIVGQSGSKKVKVRIVVNPKPQNDSQSGPQPVPGNTQTPGGTEQPASTQTPGDTQTVLPGDTETQGNTETPGDTQNPGSTESGDSESTGSTESGSSESAGNTETVTPGDTQNPGSTETVTPGDTEQPGSSESKDSEQPESSESKDSEQPESSESTTPDFIEEESAEEYVDVSSLTTYGSTTYRMYHENGGYETVTAEQDGTVHNTTGGRVTVVPVYKFEFTNQQNPADPYLQGYVKVTEKNSYNASTGYGLANAEYSINENGCKPVDGAPIKVDVPAGYYDITVYRRGGARADVYSEGVQIINNTNSAGSQNRSSGSAVMYAPGIFVENGNVDLTFGNTSGNNERIASVEIVRVPEKFRKPVIWVAGDSESAHYYPINADGDDLLSQKIMMTGFGMQLEKYLSDHYAVANWGQPSATAGTWNAECLAAITQRMQKGDTILIDFGINDAVSSSNRVDIATAKANIKAIVDAAKSKGATPILITPVYNAKYQHKTYFTYNKDSDSNELKDFARELGVSCFDLNKYTMLYTQTAIAETKDANWITNNYHVADNLHMTQHSALLDASFICAALKKLGYETTDYAYTYHDLSSLKKASESDTAATLRGEESGVTRVYSVAEAEKFIAANASPKEIYTKMWNFDTNQTAADGVNVPVISGTAVWDETYQNVKFPADTKETGELRVALVPAASGNTIRVSFDLYVGMLGNQRFSYEIMDNEGTSLMNCSFEKRSSGSNGTLVIAGQSVGDSDAIAAAIQAKSGNPMNNSVTHMVNEFNFDERTVKVTIGSTVFTGALTGAETAAVSAMQMKSVRSATNGERHIHMDNLSVKGYEIASAGGDTQTGFPDFESAVYTGNSGVALPYRIARPQSAQSDLPVVVFLHGETRKGTNNESQLYNAQFLYQAIRDAGIDCIFVAPQCPQNSTWADMAATVCELAGQLEGADSDRIYAAGYSEGGDACYDLLETGIFAAAVPVAAVGDTSKARAIASANAAVLAINGSNETENARDMIKALLGAGDTCAEYSEVYGAGSGILEPAAKLGTVEWLFAKSLSENAKKTPRKVDLAIFMGQSNMAGRGEYADAIACPIGHGYEFRSVTEPGMLFQVSGPFGKQENNDAVNDNGSDGADRRSGDMVSALMESYYQQTKTPLVGVQCSRGGSDLNYWNKAAQKAEAQARLSAAKNYLEKNGYEIGRVFMVWVQGEADADKVFKGSETLDAYKSSTLSVFQYMKEAGLTDMFIVQTGHYNGTDADAAAHDEAYVKVHDAQAELAAENQNVYTVGSLLEYKDSMKDQYHYHQDAYNEVGTAAGAAIAQVYAQ